MTSMLPVARKASADCRIMLQYMEGSIEHPGQPVLEAYLCSSGVPTIGYGHTKGVKLGQRITPGQADKFLTEDIQDCEDAIWRNVHVPLTQGQFDALVSWVFNFGERRFKDWNLLQIVNNPSRWNEIPRQWIEYVHEVRDNSAFKTRGLLVRRFRELCRWHDFSAKVCLAASTSENVQQKTIWSDVAGPNFARKQFYEHPGTTTWLDVLTRARSLSALWDESDESDVAPEPVPEPPPPPPSAPPFVPPLPPSTGDAPSIDAPEPLVLDTPIQPPPEPVTVQEAPPAALTKETPIMSAPTEAKPALKSKTIWGVVILAMAPFVAQIGDALQVAGSTTTSTGEAVADITSTAMTFFGAILAVIGRMAAGQPLK